MDPKHVEIQQYINKIEIVTSVGFYSIRVVGFERNYKKLFIYLFKFRKSVHHHTIQINHQLDAKVSPVYYLTFIYSSKGFGRPHAHHQELNNCSSNLWFYLRSVVIAVLLVVVGLVGGPDHEQQHC